MTDDDVKKLRWYIKNMMPPPAPMPMPSAVFSALDHVETVREALEYMRDHTHERAKRERAIKALEKLA